ncbi:unnamed protein product [Didymodactylos carnosus]|uniref:Uncharacterized protein n=1 Tax=Didymodactylos carnosus TaxID=1234261 RepID=A0A8S2JP25_9BILA|nr:unnamed protein product [Didymodactylos carnosus]CAF3819426.1 unnamed protein product [Didymodactylos carnosus]
MYRNTHWPKDDINGDYDLNVDDEYTQQNQQNPEDDGFEEGEDQQDVVEEWEEEPPGTKLFVIYYSSCLHSFLSFQFQEKEKSFVRQMAILMNHLGNVIIYSCYVKLQSNVSQYQSDHNEKFPTIVDYKTYARDVLKKIFTLHELAESIVLENKRFSRPPLEPARFQILKDAIRSKYRISLNQWDAFYKNGLQRTLSQLLCDSRIKLKKQQQIMLSTPLPPAASTTMGTDSQTD